METEFQWDTHTTTPRMSITGLGIQEFVAYKVKGHFSLD